ncbi:hypothetical protein QUF72_00335 [Desulfobacterales bacterium HSG2]|nr:hypothetical protein [Desulfobacterales bacterium HSG2]
MGHFFSPDPESIAEVGKCPSFMMGRWDTPIKRCVPPPPVVIPGRTEKMGHFFSPDPESIAEVGKCPSFKFDMMGRWDTP